MSRFEYRLELERFQPVVSLPEGVSWRNPSDADVHPLAELMLDAYLDTIDYDGETLEDALNEVRSYFSNLSDEMGLEASRLVFMGEDLASACLVSFWEDRHAPLIAYVMTAARWKGRHLATGAVTLSLKSLADAGYSEVRAVITGGNLPSERVFSLLGFTQLIPG